MTTHHLPLNDGWRLVATSAPAGLPDTVRDVVIDAEVPGFVHTDLLTAGLIDDPYLGRNEEELQWIGRTDWRYRSTFAAPAAGERQDLVFQGLDTIAEIFLNGQSLGTTKNMHRTYRFDVRGLLRDENELVVEFAAVLDHIEERRDTLGKLPHSEPVPYNEIRKMACNFGWDWGPSVAGAGIWKPVEVHTWDDARLASVRPHVTVTDSGTGHVAVDVHVERAADDGEPLTARIAIDGRTAEAVIEPGTDHVRVELDVPSPRLWWPVGRGEQNRYDLEVVLLAGDEVLDTDRRKVGFRTVVIDTSADDAGTKFVLYVNGERVQVRGVNWIPDDCFPTRVDEKRYRERLEQTVAVRANLVRVWGGGAFETETFYDICDELGLLTWQDFLFACAAYREDPDTAAEIEAEVRDNLPRLMSHPSLITWCGCNENLWAQQEWPNWPELGDRAWGHGYYYGLLPDLVAELDPTRSYLPGSPFSPVEGVRANDERYSLTHIWDVWNELDYTTYRDKRPRFTSEFGYSGPATWATFARALGEENIGGDSPVTAWHMKAENGMDKLHNGMGFHFPVPADGADWHFLGQLNQARAVNLGVEWFRSLGEHCGGTIMWQINDCWPVISWAAVDGDGHPKPLFYSLRHAYAPRLVTIQPAGDGLAVVLDNDTAETWTAELAVRRVSTGGKTLETAVLSAEVPARQTVHLALPDAIARPGDAAGEFLVVDGGPRRATWFFARDKELDYPRAAFAASAETHGDTVEVTVRAESLLRDLCLFPDRVDPDATVDDMLVTLLPGESHTFRVRGPAVTGADAPLLTTAPVLRCVNDRDLTA